MTRVDSGFSDMRNPSVRPKCTRLTLLNTGPRLSTLNIWIKTVDICAAVRDGSLNVVGGYAPSATAEQLKQDLTAYNNIKNIYSLKFQNARLGG